MKEYCNKILRIAQNDSVRAVEAWRFFIIFDTAEAVGGWCRFCMGLVQYLHRGGAGSAQLYII